MHVVGQFPRFLCSHYQFLKTVVKKLNEFMHEKHPGVQDMASEVFLKIAKVTASMFVQEHETGQEPYVYTLIRTLPDNTNELEDKHKLHVYEGIGYMIAEEKDVRKQEMLLSTLMQYTNQDWKQIIEMAKADSMCLQQDDVIRMISFIVRVNERVAYSVGSQYYLYLANIFQELLQVYKLYSDNISYAYAEGQAMSNGALLRVMKTVRRDVLKLITTFISKTQNHEIVITEFLPALSDLIIDYNNNVPDARDPEVLFLFATMVKHLGEALTAHIPKILEYLFASTLGMISENFTAFMDFRKGFFTLVKNIVYYSTPGLFDSDQQSFKTFIDSIIWAFKHDQPELAEIGLESMSELLLKVAFETAVCNEFFKNFYMAILQDVFFVLTDGMHQGNFQKQVDVLTRLFAVIENGVVTSPLMENTEASRSNKDFIIGWLSEALSQLFTNMNKA